VTSIDPHKLLVSLVFFPVCAPSLVGASLAVGDACSGRGCTRMTVIGMPYNAILLIGMILLGVASHMTLLIAAAQAASF
jgi:hypothetical protein